MDNFQPIAMLVRFDRHFVTARRVVQTYKRQGRPQSHIDRVLRIRALKF